MHIYTPPPSSPLLPPPPSSLHWVSEDGAEQLDLAYPDIAIHAISRDTSSFPHHCIFLLHCPPTEEEEEEGWKEGSGEGVEEGGGEDVEMTEIRLVPPGAAQCQ